MHIHGEAKQIFLLTFELTLIHPRKWINFWIKYSLIAYTLFKN